MTAIEQAEDFYKRMQVSMCNDIAYHLKHGYIFVGPDYAMWGHAVRRDDGLPEKQCGVTNPDAWYVRFAVGDGWLRRFFSMMPYPLPYVGWARWEHKRPVKYFKLDNLQRRLSYGI